ncbi:putative F420-dependent dehydrogenase [marine actinobacterium PHSC20C1]|nr:putative F420-dependent dehydrogenase [marine actinobacterium PHSC20C1]
MNDVALGVGFGPGTLGFPPGEVMLRFGELAEELGFAHFWANDHLSWPHPLVDPLVLLSAVAARTQHIGLATGVYLLPLRSPAATARAFASLDYVSGGRVILGVGVGGEFAADFSAAGITADRRGARADSAMRLLHRLWQGEPVDHHDDFYELDHVSVLPRPIQRDIPIIAGGRSEAALRRAATLADGWMPYLMSPERIRQGIDRLREISGKQDHRVIAHVFTFFGENRDRARKDAIAYLSSQYQRDMERTVDRCVPHGPAEVVAEELRRFAEAGVTDIVIRPLAEPDQLLRSLEQDAGTVRSLWLEGSRR